MSDKLMTADEARSMVAHHQPRGMGNGANSVKCMGISQAMRIAGEGGKP